MKKKMTKEEAEARIKRLEWVQSEIHRCVAQGLPVSSLKVSKSMPKTKTKSKFVRVTREEALKNRVHTYPYLIV